MPRHRLCRAIAIAGFVLAVALSDTASGKSPSYAREEALSAIPYEKLTPAAGSRIRSIVDRPTIYRHMPDQQIACDPSMFLFLVRNPDVIVGIWQRMDVSKVETKRVGPYQLLADDHAGTKCSVDLVYGDSRTHIFVAKGIYDGPLAPRPVTGSGVFVLRSQYSAGADGQSAVEGSLDCFLQIDSVGADLIARTLSGLIGRTADQNFVETAKFLSQVSSAARENPTAMRDLAMDLPVELNTRQAFADAVIDVAQRSGNLLGSKRSSPFPVIADKSDESLTPMR